LFMKLNSRKVILFLQHDYFVLIWTFPVMALFQVTTDMPQLAQTVQLRTTHWQACRNSIQFWVPNIHENACLKKNTSKQNLYVAVSKVPGIRWYDWQELLQEGIFPKIVKEMYIDIFRYIRDTVRRKHSKKWRTNGWCFLHDNAPAHRSVFVNDFLAKNNVTTLQHPPHSPDLAPADFYHGTIELNHQWRDGGFVMLLT
jgi:hypothetical protein